MHRLFAFLLFCVGLPAVAAPECTPHPEFRAADFSAPITDLGDRNGFPAEFELIRLGIQTIIRYYDHPNETIPCKTLTPPETDFLIRNGFSVAVVFQHNNDRPMTFLQGDRGRKDAARALELAAANGQPSGSAIYFGVDGVDEALKGASWQYGRNKGAPISGGQAAEMAGRMGRGPFDKHREFYEIYRTRYAEFFQTPPNATPPEAILPYIRTYFEQIAAVFAEHTARTGQSYRIGGYGSGLVCDFVLERGLVDFCWLAQSTGWPGYKDFLTSGRWSLEQQLVTTCRDWPRKSGGPVSLDFNRVADGRPDFGQWNEPAPRSRSYTAPIRKSGVSCYPD